MGFINLEKTYHRVNREILWQVLGMYDVSGKLLNGIGSMYINSLSCGRVVGSESECFRIDSGERQRRISSPWLFNVYMNIMMKKVEIGMGRRGKSGYCLASCMQDLVK